MSEWISVDFAVPPDERHVLIRSVLKWTRSNGKEMISHHIHIGSRIVFKNGNIKWRNKNGGYIATHQSETKVTHWMPLPDMPKE